MIIDVDQNINQLNCPQPGLDQVLCGLDGVRLILLLKRGQVKGAFRRINSQRLVSENALIDFCCKRGEAHHSVGRCIHPVQSANQGLHSAELASLTTWGSTIIGTETYAKRFRAG